MTDIEILAKVKTDLGITGTYHDSMLEDYIFEVKEFLIDAGVTENVLNNKISVGVIVRGVSDLWTYGPGQLSEYFYQRTKQLIHKKIEVELEGTLGILTVTSVPGTEVLMSKITVEGASENAILRYKITAIDVALPEYHETASDYIIWDGVSEIEGEDGHTITVVETNSEGLIEKAGNTILSVNLE